MAMTDLIPWRSPRSMFRRESEPFTALQREMNRLFEDFWGDARSMMSSMPSMMEAGWPSLDMQETDQAYRITAEIPGLEEKDVQLDLRDNVLMISGEKKDEREEKAGGRFYSERTYGHFRRTIPLAAEIDADKVQATFRNGVLTVDLPKNPKAQEKIRRIPINAAQAQSRH